MAIATVTSKGQITIPKEVREAVHLDAGDRVVFRVRDDGVVEMEVAAGDLRQLRGCLRPRRRGVTLADMDRAIADGARGR
jgi:AbrB family looped-hinge helix DNA binding protein